MKNDNHPNGSSDQTDSASKRISAGKTRRIAIKSILLSGGIMSGGSLLPRQWARPVVDSVILPSHAATTDDSGSLPGEGTTTPTPAVNYFYNSASSQAQLQNGQGTHTKMFAERALDTVIPTAHADQAPYIAYACIAITGNTYTARIVWSPYGDYADFDGITGTVGTTKTLPYPAPGYGEFCLGTGVGPATMLIDNVTATSCSCAVSGDATTVTITVDQGPCSPPFISQCED